MEAADKLLKFLQFKVVRRLDGLMQGDYSGIFYGPGMELGEVREYQLGDDVRRIDWNVTARTARVHVRQYIEEREITAWLLVDLSPSIDFGTSLQSKHDLVTQFVGLMAHLYTRHGNRVGAILYGDRIGAVIPARGGRRHVLHILHAMRTRPTVVARATPTDLDVLLRAGYDAIRRRSLVFVVSDFISRPGWAATLAHLAQRHEVIAVRLYDPLERELPDLGLLVIQDSETGEQIFVDTHDKGFRKRFARLAEAREEELRGAFRNAGVDALELSTDDDLADAIMRFADLRKRRSQLAAGGGVPQHLGVA